MIDNHFEKLQWWGLGDSCAEGFTYASHLKIGQYQPKNVIVYKSFYHCVLFSAINLFSVKILIYVLLLAATKSSFLSPSTFYSTIVTLRTSQTVYKSHNTIDPDFISLPFSLKVYSRLRNISYHPLYIDYIII